LAFPRGHDIRIKNSPPLDWSHPESHTTRVLSRQPGRADFERSRDDLRYYAALLWSGGGALADGADPHHFVLRGAAGSDVLELRLAFARQPLKAALPTWTHVRFSTGNFWEDFWRTGAAVDFSACT